MKTGEYVTPADEAGTEVASEPSAGPRQVRDYTQGSINAAIWALAVPMTLEMAASSVYQILDLVWVGRLGPAELAAVSVSSSVYWIINSMANGLGIGGLAIVARRIGARRFRDANHATVQAVLLALIVGFGLTVLGLITRAPLLRSLGAGPDIFPMSMTYLEVMYGGLFTLVLLNVNNAILRGAGNASAALTAFVVARGLTVALEPFIVLGWAGFPRLGVTGAAAATVAGQIAGVGYQLYMLTTGRARVRIERQHLKPDLPLMRQIIEIGLPSTIQMMLRAASRAAIMGLVGMFGTLALAGYGVANRIMLTALIPGFGMGNAAGTLVGQNLGAQKPRRAERSAWIIAAYNLAFMGTIVLAVMFFAESFIAFFNDTPQVVEYGALCLRILGIGYLFSAVGVVMGRALDGAGNTVPAMAINAITLWGISIPVAYVLARVLAGAHGVWIGLAAGNVANGLLMAFWFRRGRWKHREI